MSLPQNRTQAWPVRRKEENRKCPLRKKDILCINWLYTLQKLSPPRPGTETQAPQPALKRPTRRLQWLQASLGWRLKPHLRDLKSDCWEMMKEELTQTKGRQETEWGGAVLWAPPFQANWTILKNRVLWKEAHGVVFPFATSLSVWNCFQMKEARKHKGNYTNMCKCHAPDNLDETTSSKCFYSPCSPTPASKKD